MHEKINLWSDGRETHSCYNLNTYEAARLSEVEWRGASNARGRNSWTRISVEYWHGPKKKSVELRDGQSHTHAHYCIAPELQSVNVGCRCPPNIPLELYSLTVVAALRLFQTFSFFFSRVYAFVWFFIFVFPCTTMMCLHSIPLFFHRLWLIISRKPTTLYERKTRGWKWYRWLDKVWTDIFFYYIFSSHLRWTDVKP